MLETVYTNDFKFILERNRYRDIDVVSWPKKTIEKTDLLIYSLINSRATLIDSVAYLLAYGKTFKNTACACYSSAAINRADTVCPIDFIQGQN